MKITKQPSSLVNTYTVSGLTYTQLTIIEKALSVINQRPETVNLYLQFREALDIIAEGKCPL